jgi:hypothetical protein
VEYRGAFLIGSEVEAMMRTKISMLGTAVAAAEIFKIAGLCPGQSTYTCRALAPQAKCPLADTDWNAEGMGMRC